MKLGYTYSDLLLLSTFELLTYNVAMTLNRSLILRIGLCYYIAVANFCNCREFFLLFSGVKNNYDSVCLFFHCVVLS